MERQGMGSNERRAELDAPEGASAPVPDDANRGETEAGGVSEPVDQPWWEGGSRHDEADDDKPHDAGDAPQATPAESHKHRPRGYMYRGVTYGAVPSEPEPGAMTAAGDEPPDEVVLAVMSEEPAEPEYGGLASEPGSGATTAAGDDEPPDAPVAAVMSEEPAGGPAVEEGAQAEPAMDSPWTLEGSRSEDAGGDEEEHPASAVSMSAGHGGLASEPGSGATTAAGDDEPPDAPVAAVMSEEPAGGPAVEEGAQAEPAMDSPPWWPEGSRPGDADGDEEGHPVPAVSMPAGHGGLASEPVPGAAAGDDEPAAAAMSEEPVGGPAVEEGAQAEPVMDSPPWWPEGSRPGDADGDEEGHPVPAVSMPAGYGGLASEPVPGATAAAGQGPGAGSDEEEREARDRVDPVSSAGLPRAAEGMADVPPVELIRSIVAEVCPDELLLVDTTEAPMPEWAHAAVTAARNDLERRSAERRAVDAGEYLRLAIAEHIMGLHEDADAHLKEALPQSDRFGPVLNALAVTNLARGKIAPAIVYCKEALRETDGDSAVRAAASSNLGDLYRIQGDASQAAEAYEAAIHWLGSQGEAHGLPRLHFHAGCLYRHLGETDKARAHLSESVRLFKESGDETGHIRALGTLGLALNDLGLYDLALRSFEEGVRICLRTGDKPGAALVQDGMGVVYMSQGQLTRALAYLESALSLHRELGDHEGEAATRDNIGKIHRSRGEPATRPQESGDQEGKPSRSLEAEEILRRAGSAELQEKRESG